MRRSGKGRRQKEKRRGGAEDRSIEKEKTEVNCKQHVPQGMP